MTGSHRGLRPCQANRGDRSQCSGCPLRPTVPPMAATLRTRSRRSSRQTAWHRRDLEVAIIQSLIVTNEVLVSRPCHSLIWGIACSERLAARLWQGHCAAARPKYLPATKCRARDFFSGSSGLHDQQQSSANSDHAPRLETARAIRMHSLWLPNQGYRHRTVPPANPPRLRCTLLMATAMPAGIAGRVHHGCAGIRRPSSPVC